MRDDLLERLDEGHWPHLPMLKEAAARIRELEAQARDWQASQHYSYIGRDGKRVLARDLEDRAEAELTALRAAADGLAGAGDAMITFHNGPAEEKRPDIWRRLLQRFDAALATYAAARGVAK